MSHFSTGCTTRYCEASVRRGARIIARHILSGKRASTMYDFALSMAENHEAAALKLLKACNLKPSRIMPDTLIAGSTDDGYVFLIGRPLKEEE